MKHGQRGTVAWVAALFAALSPHPAVAQTTKLVSAASDGTQANGNSGYCQPAISADGRYIAFDSDATNLVAGDINGFIDVFVRDTVANKTTRVSVASDGTQGNGNSGYYASISADGRYVAFESPATNLVPDDTNAQQDIFVRDTVADITTRVNLAMDGSQSNAYSSGPSISADGRYIAFNSYATNLVAGDTNASLDVFVCGPLSAVAPYMMADALRAVRVTAGLAVASQNDVVRLNVQGGGNSIDITDAARIARKATGLDSNP